MVSFATTSQIVGNKKSDGLRNIKKRYDKALNITTIKVF
jgi:hypothetical protein